MKKAEIMKRTELKKLWVRSKRNKKFRRLLLAMLAALVWVQQRPYTFAQTTL
jgi:hypothetical protein